MITYNGFKTTRCHLEGNNVVIDGEFYPIFSIQQRSSYKPGIIMIYLILAAGTIYAAYKSLIGTVVVFIPIWWFLLRIHSNAFYKGRSFWKINGRDVSIEQNDDSSLEQQFREISLNLYHHAIDSKTSGAKPPSNIKALVGLGLFIFFLIILVLGFTRHVSEKIEIPLFMGAIAAIMIFRFCSLKDDFENLKWKK
jgi:hypothetical protein